MIRLDIISDIDCPWCYVGKDYLDRALEARPDHPFAIEWHPFQLNPELPRTGMDRRLYMEAKFGGKDGAVRAYLPLLEHAAAAGVELNFDRIGRQPNTLDAHRLIHWAGLEGRQTPMVAALFRAFWRDGRDLTDPETLVDIAAGAGLDEAVIRRLLGSDADAEDIRARDAHSRERGENAEPAFIIADRHVLQGAQPTGVWTDIIDDIARQLAERDDL